MMTWGTLLAICSFFIFLVLHGHDPRADAVDLLIFEIGLIPLGAMLLIALISEDRDNAVNLPMRSSTESATRPSSYKKAA